MAQTLLQMLLVQQVPQLFQLQCSSGISLLQALSPASHQVCQDTSHRQHVCHFFFIFRNQRPQIYPDTTAIKAGQGYGRGNCCPRCGGAVYEAEKVTEKGHTYHKQCFTCISCHRPCDKLQVQIGFDNQLYCHSCYPSIQHKPLPPDPEATARIQAQPGDGSGCLRCGGRVYEAEKVMVGHGLVHKSCFSCGLCYRPMDYFNCFSHQVKIKNYKIIC